MANTFVILDTPPDEHNLRYEHSTASVEAIFPRHVILLKRDELFGMVHLLSRVHTISSRGRQATLHKVTARNITEFPSLAQPGDHVVVLLTRDWEEYVVT